MYKINEPKNLLETAYLQKGTIGYTKIADAPIVNFFIAISGSQDIVAGIVEIKYSEDKPSIKLNVTGTIRYVSYENICKIIDLEGEYMVPISNSVIGSYFQRFTAHIDIGNGIEGVGSFTFGNQSIHNAPLKT